MLTQTMAQIEVAHRIWIAHNYNPSTGYAWDNISALFGSIESHFPAVRTYDDTYSFSERGWRSLRALTFVRRKGIREVYLTDQPPARLLYAALRLAGVRKILIHNRISVASPYPAKADSFPRRACKWLWNRLPFITADRVFAVSNFVAQRLTLKAQVPKAKITVIHNGIDTARFLPAQGEPRTIFVGCRADQHKGVAVLIEACALLKERGVDFSVRYAGNGPDFNPLADRVLQLGLQDRFTFLGYLKDISQEMRQASIVAIPANWGDACPSAVLEAMACGKSIVATRAGGIPELIEDGVSGLLVPPGNVKALADALERVLSDPDAGSLGVAARARAVRHFDIRRYHGEVVEQMRKALA